MIAHSSLGRPKDNIIFGFSETHLNSLWPNSELEIDGYNIIRKDRAYAGGGGLLVYVPVGIKFTQRIDLEVQDINSHLEYVWIEIQFPKSKSFLVCFIYQPGNTNSWKNELDYVLAEVIKSRKKL